MWNERDGVSPAKVSDEALGLCGVDVACAVDQWNGADIWSRHLLLSGGRHDTVSHSVNMPVILHQASLDINVNPCRVVVATVAGVFRASVNCRV